MERIERLVVHVDEAMRLADREDVASQRLSLLLFDSAAELLLYREADYRLQYESVPRRLLEMLDELKAQRGSLTDEQAATRKELLPQVTSARQRRRIEREFDAKASYLERAGLLTSGVRRVLVKLHQYRNEAYHRDELREATLVSAVRIYRFLVCQMMRDFPIHVISSRGSAPVPAVMAEFEPAHGMASFDLQSQIAQTLLQRHSADPAGDLANALSDHVADRLDTIDEILDSAAEHLQYMRSEPSWDRSAILAVLQLDGPIVTLTEARAAVVQITLATLDTWRAKAETIRNELDPVAAFGLFADAEDELEPIEDAAFEAARSIDQYYQDESDRLRGK